MNAKLRDKPHARHQHAGGTPAHGTDAASHGAVAREYAGQARTGARSGRHGRPRPFGGFRLPSLRFSGAAMAMSTVLGISVATTWLLSEQQNIGRRPGVSNVGASPPLPSPDQSDATGLPPTPAPSGPARAEAPSNAAKALGTPRTAPRGTAAPSTTAPAASPSARTGDRPPASGGAPSASASGAAPPSASPGSTAGSGTTGPGATGPTGPSSSASAGPSATTGPRPDTALSGQGSADPVGTTGIRHTLALAVGENVTALQVELRLARPEALPGTTPWSSLPGAVVTIAQDRGSLVYRFTAPVGLDLAPGRYTFGVRGARPTDGLDHPPQETWAASAFALDDPRALAVRGAFS
ncbi:hypothetical protein ACFC1R_33535 [Kitasatospora sp. NPDC056138]|uniref:hypothetical protein n=1 Tax=Kitasatospora sp. NPDC056138 TaxID=3345724 RepID=UPI0035E10325